MFSAIPPCLRVLNPERVRLCSGNMSIDTSTDMASDLEVVAAWDMMSFVAKTHGIPKPHNLCFTNVKDKLPSPTEDAYCWVTINGTSGFVPSIILDAKGRGRKVCTFPLFLPR
jgi:hypothetical protein